jgi:chromosome segregation ATPase
MQAADILYGVTMGADGISQVVSRRMPADAAAPTLASA